MTKLKRILNLVKAKHNYVEYYNYERNISVAYFEDSDYITISEENLW